ncbi:hypothetical protein ACIGEZ_12185 [Streptomyces sp. NPDC085481]|uniref:hypothetical protein n=1 Tax=Streptomyces sp. NPDC085481 TaxID=3365727 RepID=UPI0037D24D73
MINSGGAGIFPGNRRDSVLASLRPDPAQLRAHLHALAVLDATIGDDPQFCQYTFDTAWGVTTALRR